MPHYLKHAIFGAFMLFVDNCGLAIELEDFDLSKVDDVAAQSIIQDLQTKTYLTQFSFQPAADIAPATALAVGEYLLVQLKNYWALQPELQKEVELTITGAYPLIQLGKYVMSLDPHQSRYLWRKIQEGTSYPGLKFLTGPNAARWVAQFKYIGPRDDAYVCKTALGNFLKKVLMPAQIHLSYDPQLTFLQHFDASFIPDFARAKSSLVLNTAILREILQALPDEDFTQHPIVAHELGHYKMDAAAFHGKAVFGDTIIEAVVTDLKNIRPAMIWLSHDDHFARARLDGQECYTSALSAYLYSLKTGQAISAILRQQHPLESEDLQNIQRPWQAMLKSLQEGQTYYQALATALAQINEDLKENSPSPEFGRGIFYNDFRDVYSISFRLKRPPEIAPADGPAAADFTYSYYLSKNIFFTQPELVQSSTTYSQIWHVYLSPVNEALLKEFIQQQDTYVAKQMKILFHAQQLVRPLDQQIKELIQNFTQLTPAAIQKQIQRWQKDRHQLEKTLHQLAVFPPFFGEKGGRWE